jgi:hypothetical protein
VGANYLADMFQIILVIVLFIVALGYVIRLIVGNFTKKEPSCASGCGKCGVDFNKIQQQLEKHPT